MLSEEAKEKISRIVQLVSESEISSIKNVTSGIIKIINNPKSNARDLKNIIELDPPLTAKVLRTANSAYYYSHKHISEIDEAVIWIGFEKLKEIALNQKVCEIFQKNETIKGYSRELLWKHCIAVALLGKMIYRMEFGESGENIYAAGLLHDIGVITEDQFLTDDFKEILNRSFSEERCLHEVETEVLGFSHADIGKAITEYWNFPPGLRQCIGLHHHCEIEEIPQEYFKMTATLILANCICNDAGMGYVSKPRSEKRLYKKCLEALNIKKYSLDLIMQKMKSELQKMEKQGFF